MLRFLLVVKSRPGAPVAGAERLDRSRLLHTVSLFHGRTADSVHTEVQIDSEIIPDLGEYLTAMPPWPNPR